LFLPTDSFRAFNHTDLTVCYPTLFVLWRPVIQPHLLYGPVLPYLIPPPPCCVRILLPPLFCSTITDLPIPFSICRLPLRPHMHDSVTTVGPTVTTCVQRLFHFLPPGVVITLMHFFTIPSCTVPLPLPFAPLHFVTVHVRYHRTLPVQVPFHYHFVHFYLFYILPLPFCSPTLFIPFSVTSLILRSISDLHLF